jgi:hypothetical protein
MTHIAVSNESEQGQKSSVCLAWVRETDLKASVVLAAPGLGFFPKAGVLFLSASL